MASKVVSVVFSTSTLMDHYYHLISADFVLIFNFIFHNYDIYKSHLYANHMQIIAIIMIIIKTRISL